MPAGRSGAKLPRPPACRPESNGESAEHGATGLSEQHLLPPATKWLSVRRRGLLQRGDPWAQSPVRTSYAPQGSHANGNSGGGIPLILYCIPRADAMVPGDETSSSPGARGPRPSRLYLAWTRTFVPCASHVASSLVDSWRIPAISTAMATHDQPGQAICLLPWSMLYFRLGSTILHTLGLGRVCRCSSGSSQIMACQF
jgi:hypothetical protein